jgi:hypothetical protein
MFVLPVNCMQPFPFTTPFAALAFAALILVIGVAGVLYVSWYSGFKNTCPLTICDFWQAIKEAFIFAILAAFLVYSSLATGTVPGLLWTHLGFDLLVITLVLIPSANSQITINQNSHQC